MQINISRRQMLSQTVLGFGLLLLARGSLFAQSARRILSSVLAHDTQRPQFHFMPPSDWMNDPNGPIYFKGNYHMFYQYNPNMLQGWGPFAWGHAISTDMVHWKHLPVAIMPTKNGPDALGCWTGTAIVKDGSVYIVYTGISETDVGKGTVTIAIGDRPKVYCKESQCVAVSSDDLLLNWSKSAEALIGTSPDTAKRSGFRDPSWWKQGDVWYMTLGSGLSAPSKLAQLLLYRSSDFKRWEFVKVLTDSAQTLDLPSIAGYPEDNMWECPEFFPLGTKHVLICSTGGKNHWTSGIFNSVTLTFTPEKKGVIDYGCYYAAKTQLDSLGNRIIWGWIQERRPPEMYNDAGWAGVMSLPRILELNNQGELITRVSPEVNKLRKNYVSLDINQNEEKRSNQISSLLVKNCSAEIKCFIKKTNEAFSFSIRSSVLGSDYKGHSKKIGSELWITFTYDPVYPDKIKINDKMLSLGEGIHDHLEFSVYVDGSVIEAFVNECVAFTKRVYFDAAKTPYTGIHYTGKTMNIIALDMWELDAITQNRLTD